MAETQQLERMEPAASIVALLGGPTAVCDRLGIAESTVYRWMWREFCAGFIPRKHHDALIAMAGEGGFELTRPDFVMPRAITRDQIIARSHRLSALAV